MTVAVDRSRRTGPMRVLLEPLRIEQCVDEVPEEQKCDGAGDQKFQCHGYSSQSPRLCTAGAGSPKPSGMAATWLAMTGTILSPRSRDIDIDPKVSALPGIDLDQHPIGWPRKRLLS